MEWTERSYRLPPAGIPVLARIDLEDEPPFIVEGVADWTTCELYTRDATFEFSEITHWAISPDFEVSHEDNSQ